MRHVGDRRPVAVEDRSARREFADDTQPSDLDRLSPSRLTYRVIALITDDPGKECHDMKSLSSPPLSRDDLPVFCRGLLLPPSAESESLDYDLYQRYSAAARILDRMLPGVATPVRILELGPNYLNPLPRFLDPTRMTFTRADVKPVSNDPDFLRIEADAPLPFADESFDAVVALEVLEHMPADRRRTFLTECMRVARRGGVFSCPNGVPEVVAAEAYAADSFRQRHGIEHPYLQEHRLFGLPHPIEIVTILREMEWPHAVFDNAPLDVWLPMLLVSENLLEHRATGQAQLLLNQHFLGNPTAGPVSYRKLYVCAKTFDATAALEPVDAVDSCGARDPGDRLPPMLHHLAAAVGQALATLEIDLTARTEKLRACEAELLAFRRRQYILYAYVQSLRHSRVWKLMTMAWEAARFFRSRGFDQNTLIPWSGLELDPACPASWRVNRPDAHFIVPCHLPAGWLRIRLRLSSDRPGESLLSFDNCDDDADAVMTERFAVDGNLDRECVVYLPRPVVGLRFYPLDAVGTVHIDRLEVRTLPSLLAFLQFGWERVRGLGRRESGRSAASVLDRAAVPAPDAFTTSPTESTPQGVLGPIPAETQAAGRDRNRTGTAASGST
jgi:SAM-dependent methyltransferase